MRSGTPGCRPATRRRAPPSRPSSPRPITWSKSWWSRRDEPGSFPTRHTRYLQRLPRRARGGIRSLVPGRASHRGARRAGFFVRPPPQGGRRRAGLFQFLHGRNARGAHLKTLSGTARPSDADDAHHHVGSFYQHEPHGMPARRTARQFPRRLRRHRPVQCDTGRDGAVGRAGKFLRRHGGGRRRDMAGARRRRHAGVDGGEIARRRQEECRRAADRNALPRGCACRRCAIGHAIPARRYRHLWRALPNREGRPMKALLPLAQTIAQRLIARRETIAIAESSTGGLVAAALLAVPGASAYFLGGAVVYTEASRAALLGIGDAEMQGLRPATEAYALLLARRVR